MDFGIIILAVSNITDAELCKGSTTDSDSVCEGSNPSSAAKAPSGAKFRGVAQLGRALRSGRRGRWFESSHLDQKLTEALIRCFGQLFYYSYQESLQYKGFAPQGYAKSFVLQAFSAFSGISGILGSRVNLNTLIIQGGHKRVMHSLGRNYSTIKAKAFCGTGIKVTLIPKSLQALVVVSIHTWLIISGARIQADSPVTASLFP